MGTILDCMSTYPHVAPRNKLPTIREITSRLGRTSHIAGEDLTIADLAVVSLIKKNDLAKKWFQSFSDTANKSNISPKKSRKESEKTSQKSATKEEKSAKKEKSPNKPIKKEKSPDKNHGFSKAKKKRPRANLL